MFQFTLEAYAVAACAGAILFVVWGSARAKLTVGG